MICLRCGYCCKYYMVVIVNNPDIGIVEDNVLFHEGNGTPCKHLQGDGPGEYKCTIHDREWYGETPCFEFTQLEWGDTETPCRIGKRRLKHKGV